MAGVESNGHGQNALSTPSVPDALTPLEEFLLGCEDRVDKLGIGVSEWNKSRKRARYNYLLILSSDILRVGETDTRLSQTIPSRFITVGNTGTTTPEIHRVCEYNECMMY